MNIESGIQLSDLMLVVRRRGKLMLGVALVIFLAAYWVAMALPNEYESYATILVEPQSVSPELVQPGLGSSDINQRLGLMTAQILSRQRLSGLIDDHGLYPTESKTMVRQKVIDRMRKDVRVEPVLGELEQARKGPAPDQINTFRINFRYEDPKLARDVAQELANDFIEQHISERVNLSQKSLEFIQTELRRLAARIGEVESSVASVKAANPGRLPEDMPSNQHRLDRLLSDLAFAQRSLVEARSDEGFYRSQAAAAESLGGGGGPADDASPERKLRILELVLVDFAARGYTEKHPDVARAMAEVQGLKARQEAVQAGEVEQPASYAVQSARAESERASLQRDAAEQEIARVRQMAEEVQQLVAETPRVAEQLDALSREYRHLFASYQDYSSKLLEATVQAQLERRQLGEQFRVIETAFAASEPSSPNRAAIIALGAIAGLMLAAALAILVEATDPSVHDVRQLATALDVPVLGQIPEVWLESDIAARRRRRVRSAVATTALVAFGVLGGAANYVWVNAPGLVARLSGAAPEAAEAEEAPAAQPPAAEPLLDGAGSDVEEGT